MDDVFSIDTWQIGSWITITVKIIKLSYEKEDKIMGANKIKSSEP
jgi:hypothetical protein